MSSIYFLATGDDDALRISSDSAGPPEADSVLAHEMITVPHLTSLADVAEGFPVSVDLSVVANVWPPMPDDPESDLAWMAEPTIERIADILRDRIAAIDPDTVSSWVEAWGVQVSGSVEEDAWPSLAVDLIRLARRGRDRGLGLYNRYEL